MNIQLTPLPGQATIFEQLWEDRAKELELEAVGNVRGVAEKWAGTIATLLGIFGVVLVVKGPADIAKVTGSSWFLKHEWSLSNQVWIGIAVGVAVLAAVIATWLAAQAAYGFPKKILFVGAEVRKKSAKAASTSAWYLFGARISVLVAVLALGLAIGLTWYKTPASPSAVSNVLVLNADGQRMACGVLQAAGDHVSILQEDEDVPVVVPVADLAFVTSVASCPGDG